MKKIKFKRIRPFSKARENQIAAYVKLKRVWWNDPVNKFCKAPGCSSIAIELHHGHGRVGKLLNVVKYWIPLCSKCHLKVHQEPVWARAAGLICARGQWNSGLR